MPHIYMGNSVEGTVACIPINYSVCGGGLIFKIIYPKAKKEAADFFRLCLVLLKRQAAHTSPPR